MHVFIHYLFTSTYECLQHPKNKTKCDKATAEFVTATGTYALSRMYELSSLGELAKAEIERLSNELPFPVAISLMKDADLVIDTADSWLTTFFKKRLILVCSASSFRTRIYDICHGTEDAFVGRFAVEMHEGTGRDSTPACT